MHRKFGVEFKLSAGEVAGKLIKEFDYKSKKWKHKRLCILRRDKYLCVECQKSGRRREAVTVHHILHTDEYPELGYDDNNLVSLCNACHNKMHPEKGGRKY